MFVTASALLAIACCTRWGEQPEAERPPPKAKTEAVVAPASDTKALTEANADLDKCEEELDEAGKKTKVRTRIKTVEVEKLVPGPPLQCAIDGPVLEPVVTTTCQANTLCLDERAQAALAGNELAWRQWSRRVIQCETGGAAQQKK